MSSVLFFGLLFLWIRLGVNPALIYHGYWITERFPLLSWDIAFFGEFLTYPGGPVAYVSALLCQFYYFPWVGALIVTLVAWVLCLATRVFIESVSGTRPHALHFAPAVLLVLLYGRYANPLGTALALSAAMFCVCLYVRMALRAALPRLAAFVVLGAALGYVAGGAALTYATLCGIFELASKRRVLGLIYVASAMALLCAAAVCILHVGIEEAYARLLPPFGPESDAVSAIFMRWLYLFFPFAALGMTLQRRFAAEATRCKDQDGSGAPAGTVERIRSSVLVRFMASCGLLAVVAAGVWFLFDVEFRSVLRVEYYAQLRKWPQLLSEARRLPVRRYDLNVKWNVNRALHYTGRLPHEMFSYPQERLGLAPSGAALVRLKVRRPVYMKYSDVLFELGRVNESEHMAHEALELLGDRPSILRRLALINVVKEQPAAARVFLGALGRDVIHRQWARDCLRRLKADRFMSTDAEVRGIRSSMLVEDAVGPFAFEELLRLLLQQNKQNRMAFEYLMAHYLLAGRIEEVVRNISRLDDFDDPGIPRHYEEAIVLYERTAGKEVDLGGRTVSADAERRFGDFRQLLTRCGDDRDAARDALRRRHGDSYFFYHEFCLTGSAE